MRPRAGLFVLVVVCAAVLPAVATESTASTSIRVTGTLRDFSKTHPDFEYAIAEELGIVQLQLGPDDKPVYAKGNGSTSATTTGKANFDQWYRDTPGVNYTYGHAVTFEQVPGSNPPLYEYEGEDFFPLDGVSGGWGKQGEPHNYWFTYEIHTTFRYNGGETFEFVGDDDFWAFINGRRVIDLGGVHGPMSQTVRLDNIAAAAGLQRGSTYPLDLFFAERHTYGSNFTIRTTMALVQPVPTQIVADAIVGSAPPPQVGAGSLRARLTSAGQPVAGRALVLSATRVTGGTYTCTATTGADGYAACGGVDGWLAGVLGLGFEARFSGDSQYLPSAARGALIKVGDTAVGG